VIRVTHAETGAPEPPPDDDRDAAEPRPGDPATNLRDDSDELLAAVDRIRTLESSKRDTPMSTPEFHSRADEIEDIARSVFGLARRQRREGDQLSGPDGRSINDVDPRDDPESHEEDGR
jgi:hypothetical protein